MRLLTAALLTGGAVFLPRVARADWFGIGKAVESGVGTIVYGLLYLFGWISAQALSFCGVLIDFAFNLNSQIITSPAVQLGWIVSRDLANLGFVLVIIAIAFATVLQWSSYGMKALLAKLIVAAVLINFSLPIAGVFIDFAGTITGFFIQNSTPENAHDFGTALATAFAPQRLLDVKSSDEISDIITQEAGRGFSAIASLVFALVFNGVAIISFLALAAMFFVRFLALTILMVISPMAWLCFAFPNLSGYAGKWWSEFLRWTFFAPAVSFFIYLAMYTTLNRGQFLESALAPIDETIRDVGKGFVQNDFVTNATDMILLTGLLMGGLVVANKLGIAGADIGLKYANAYAKKVTVGAGGAAAGGVGRWASRTARTLGKNEKGEGYVQRGVNALSRVPVLGRPMGIVNAALTRASEQDQARVDALQKERYGKVSDDVLMSAASTVGRSDVQRAAVLAEIAKRGKVSKFFPSTKDATGKTVLNPDLARLIASAKAVGATKAIAKVRPELAAPDRKEGDTEEMALYRGINKAVSKAKASEIEAEAFDNALVTLSLSTGDIGTLARDGNAEQRKKIYEQIKKLRKDIENDRIGDKNIGGIIPKDEVENVKRRIEALNDAIVDNVAWAQYVSEDERIALEKKKEERKRKARGGGGPEPAEEMET
ncbi:MAG: hypothetical protein HYS43_01930 [Candidatus Liptonbacteria bacterium]|nr:hypothetical protein [Candidatus Liptonbacteria bacterium]